MTTRQASLDLPCPGTFDWIFDDGPEQGPEDRPRPSSHFSLPRWLSTQNGSFFISGKAGSGKSTIVEYIRSDERASHFLKCWASGQESRLLTASFYCWWSGSELQRSHEGLWRSILHQLLSQHRPLVSLLFPERINQSSASVSQLEKQPWCRRDLTTALERLPSSAAKESLCICLFIDGLDEYVGDELELLAELKHLLQSPIIKLCVSSRPRNVFENAFGHMSSPWAITLQRYTLPDIIRTVGHRLAQDQDFVGRFADEDKRAAFVKAIGVKAEGVFHWATLVVNEILREIAQLGSNDELEDRINEIPVELCGDGGLYHRMIDRADPRFKLLMARLLLLMLQQQEGPRRERGKLRWEMVHFLYHDAKDDAFIMNDCLGLSDKYRRPTGVGTICLSSEADGNNSTSSGVWQRVSEMSPRCIGIFKICAGDESHPKDHHCRVDTALLSLDARFRVRKWCPDLVEIEDLQFPQFAHRSVADYLSQAKTRQMLAEMAGSTFDPLITRCRLYFALSRLELGHDANRVEGVTSTLAFLHLAAELESTAEHEIRSMLDHAERVHTRDWIARPLPSPHGRDIKSLSWAQVEFLTLPDSSNPVFEDDLGLTLEEHNLAWFLALAIDRRLYQYVHQKWTGMDRCRRRKVGIVLFYGSLITVRSLDRTHEDRASLMKALLADGVNVNLELSFRFRDSKIANERPTLWELCIAAAARMWMSGEMLASIFVEDVAVILSGGKVDRNCRLPEGKETILSAMQPGLYRKKRLQERQRGARDTQGQELIKLLKTKRLIKAREWIKIWITGSTLEALRLCEELRDVLKAPKGSPKRARLRAIAFISISILLERVVPGSV